MVAEVARAGTSPLVRVTVERVFEAAGGATLDGVRAIAAGCEGARVAGGLEVVRVVTGCG